jgi:hypothetical protein
LKKKRYNFAGFYGDVNRNGKVRATEKPAAISMATFIEAAQRKTHKDT